MDKQINIEETLDWYIWAGVDETCANSVCLNSDDFAKIPELHKLKNIQSAESTNNITKSFSEDIIAPTVNFDAITKNAKDICESVSSIEELEEIVKNFSGCELKKRAASTILGEGNHKARIVLIGEAPGADEDRIGKPFVGRCGQLLNKMLAAVNIKREDCYITNILPWRPPGNRTPTDEEIAICLPFLKKQLDIIEPDILLLMGGVALKSLLDVNDSVSRMRGKWLEYTFSSGKKASVLATFHPSYLLRSSIQKSKVWIDLIRLKKKLDE